MGANQSKDELSQASRARRELRHQLEVNGQLAQRLRELELAKKNEIEGEYVYIHPDERRDLWSLIATCLITDVLQAPRYSSASTTVSVTDVKEWEKELLEDPKNRLALAALSSNDARTILTSRATTIKDTQNFNIKIPLEGAPITNQRSSGRCWLFASTNVFRVALMRQYDLKEFELSQSYLFYWDKLEKANFFLEQIIDTLDDPLDGRLIQTLLASPVGDGGQWDMVANLVEKYGLVPQTLYPDSFNAMNSSVMSSIITTKLREDALTLRSLASKHKSCNISEPSTLKSSLTAAKERMLREIHLILTLMLGPPPAPSKPFTWEYYNSSGDFRTVTTTPISFASSLSSKSAICACAGTDVHTLFSLVHDPRHEPLTHLSVSRLGNVIGGKPVRYVNVTLPTMKAAAISMIRAGIPVFFGSDVGKFSNSQKGIMDTDLWDPSLGFNCTFNMSKAQRLMTGESMMTHAMVLSAVHVDDDGKPVRWRVQNSWGTDAGTDGWFVMSDKWWDEYVYQVVVDPKFVSKEVKDVLEKEPLMLELWDPMGALA